MHAESRNCIIVHGCPSKAEGATDYATRTHDVHWQPWLEKKLEAKGISTERPIMPHPWQPDYEEYKKEFSKYRIDTESILVGHSCGAAFLVRWLGESKQEVDKLILVAPWKIPNRKDPYKKAFYFFHIDPTIKDRTKEIVMFTADNERVGGKRSLKIFHDALGGEIIELKGHGHYMQSDMVSSEFPELLAVVLR